MEWLERVGLGRLRRCSARASCPAGRPNGLRSPERWRPNPGSCCSTNRWRPSTSRPDGRCGAISRDHLASFDGMRLLVTHDPIDAYALADRVAILDAGRLVQTGTIAEVTAHPRSRYVAELVGTNRVSGIVEHGTLTTDSGARVVVADAPDGRVFAVIRPQAVVLSSAEPGRSDGTASSARNSWLGTVSDIDILGDRARVSLVGVLPLTAEVTVESVEALSLHPGDTVHATVKATDIETTRHESDRRRSAVARRVGVLGSCTRRPATGSRSRLDCAPMGMSVASGR